MKKIIISALLLVTGISVQGFAKDVVKKADQQLETLSSKSKRDKIVRKLEKQLSPEKRVELMNEIQNSDLPESQKTAITAVIDAVDDSIVEDFQSQKKF